MKRLFLMIAAVMFPLYAFAVTASPTQVAKKSESGKLVKIAVIVQVKSVEGVRKPQVDEELKAIMAGACYIQQGWQNSNGYYGSAGTRAK